MLFAPLPDQRRSERRWLTISVQIRIGRALIEGTALNLSEHGIYVFTAANLALGAEMEIQFHPPEQKNPVLVSAIVRRKVVYLYGIEFMEKGTQPADACSFQQFEDTIPDPLNRQTQR